MADSYESQFQFLLEEVRSISPQAATKLLQIQTQFGARIAYYAAFVIVCLEARAKKTDYRAVLNLTIQELDNFTYFEYAKENPQAVSEFSEMLTSYQADCQRRFAQDSNSPAAV